MCPGSWVTAIGKRADSSATCGVTPQAQKRGTSSARSVTGSPKSGCARSAMPMARGSPRWIGAPWTEGYREQIWIASIASAAGIGLMLTTILPPNGPALLQSILVRYIGTLTPSLIFLISMPAAINASSKENEHPSAKATQSSCHSSTISCRCSVSTPSCQTRYCGTSVRISISTPSSGSETSPGRLLTASRGQGLGLSVQNDSKCAASSAGRITILHCTKPGARPEVCCVKFAVRHRARISCPAMCSATATILVSKLYSAYE